MCWVWCASGRRCFTALEKAIALGRPVVIDCIIDNDDKVFPMMPAGAPLEDTFDADDLEK